MKKSVIVKVLVMLPLIALGACKSWNPDGRPRHMMSTTPDPTTAESGYRAGSVEVTAENTGASGATR